MNEQFPLAVAQQRPLHRASPKGDVIALILFAVLLILFAFTAAPTIWDIAVAQTGKSVVLATTNGVYRGDGTGQWEPFGLSNISVRSLHVVDDFIYAGTETGGVTSSSVASPSWTPIEQFAGSKIRELLYDAQFCQGLFAATAKGVFLFR